ncbi:MAG: Gfo/Idh/MocA family oxidoreductase [Saprospiraceae bacterium]|nr:Gfo/Idh/MocA family oxidoreductase [Saprospiraceae bacterium]
MKSKGSSIHRRRFIKQTAALATGFWIIPSAVLGGTHGTAPSDRITLGFIGTGKQGRGLAGRFAQLEDVQIVSACDIDEQKLDAFLNKIAEHYSDSDSKSTCRAVKHYEDLLSDPSVDAVIIATPDHWHAIQSIAAMRAGKDVFCEKPLAHTVEEGRRMVTSVAKYARILQTGSMQRSWKDFRHAAELVQNGYLGEIKRVLVNVGDPGIPCTLPELSVPDYLDWDRWIGPAPMRGYHHDLSPPLSDTRWADWRPYLEFGGGILSDWGAHMFDIAQWGLDMDRSGPVLLIPPTQAGATRGLKMIYDSGIEMTHEDFGRGWAVRFEGTDGTIDVSRSFLESEPASIVTAQIKPSEKKVYQSNNHYQDWIDAIKSRTDPICDVETGHRSASVCNIANIAYQLKRPLRWDPEKEKFAKNKEANKLLGKRYRKPYKLRR